jgi:lipid-A-disaccharide synthase
MTKAWDLFLFAGEVSGDLHGEKLLEALYKKDPQLKILGVGGPRMRAKGLTSFLPMENFQVMGFIDVLFALPRLLSLFKQVKNKIRSSSPKAVVFIDYPGFNLRMARALKRKGDGSKRIQYVCPSVWAWGKGRIPKMERSLDKLLTILPFEPHYFSKEKLDAEYIGHPLIERILAYSYDNDWKKLYGIPENTTLLSLFPGSREKEIERNFPLQLQIAKKILAEREDLTVVISCANKKFLPLLTPHLSERIKLVESRHLYELMRSTHVAIATSGTITLELALHLVPTVVTYAITLLDLFLAQYVFQIRLPHYSLPNIIAKEEIFPELFGPNLNAKNLEQATKNLLSSQLKRNLCLDGCHRIRELLGEHRTSERAAEEILRLIQ